MKTNQLRKKGFTLIELLVVIVIIGILATIGVATFQGYFAKARDTERLTGVRNIATMVKADQVVNDTPDYRLGGVANANDDGATEVETKLKAILTEQGYSVPATKQAIEYYYLIETSAVATVAADDFVVFACKESELDDANASLAGTDSDGVSAIAYVDGTGNGIAAVTEALAGDACVSTPIAPVVTGYVVVNLD